MRRSRRSKKIRKTREKRPDTKEKFSDSRKRRKNKKKCNFIITIILIIAVAVGLGLLLYPVVSGHRKSSDQARAIASYQETADNLSREEYEKLWNKGIEWNKKLAANNTGPYTLTDPEMAEYNSILDVTGTGIMGYVTIPKIGVRLPVYHGSDEAKHQADINHFEWSSFPVGGEDTHCVISGIRGLSGDKLNIGDTFVLTTLNDNLTYEVDQILVVLPEEVKDLYLQNGKDLCTLVAVTPEGVNSHRLLVRGHRIQNDPEYDLIVRGDATVINPFNVALILAVPGLVALFVWVMIQVRKGRQRKNRKGRM